MSTPEDQKDTLEANKNEIIESAESAFSQELSTNTKEALTDALDFFKSKYFLKAFTDKLPVCFFAKDTQLQYIYINDAFLKSTSKNRPEDIIGKRSKDVFSKERGDIAEEQDKILLKSGTAIFNHEICNTDAKLEDSYVLVSKVCVKDDEGNILGLAGVLFDITQRKKDEFKLRELNEKLEERNRQLENDMTLAREVQKAFLTTKLSDWTNNSLDFSFVHKASEKLSGDLFLFEQINNTTCAFFVCDVMGHGIRSALITGLIRGLYDELKDSVTRPESFISQFNDSYMDLLYSLKETIFVTVQQGIIDLRKNEVIMTSAGHHDPLWFKKAEGVFHPSKERLVEPGPAIGLLKGYEYEKSSFIIEPGDSLLLFTDGLSECGAPEKDEFGEEGIQKAFLARKDLCGQEIIDGIVNDAQEYAEKIDDDVCLLRICIPENQS